VSSSTLGDEWKCSDATWRPGSTCEVVEDADPDADPLPSRQSKRSAPSEKLRINKELEAVRLANIAQRAAKKAKQNAGPTLEERMTEAAVALLNPPPVAEASPTVTVHPHAEDAAAAMRSITERGRAATNRDGHLRSEMLEIVTLAHTMRIVSAHWAAHNARGARQELAMSKMRDSLKTSSNVVLCTIDMKSKTTAAKHRTDQGFGFGLRGMSMQGCMVGRWVRPIGQCDPCREVSYIDTVCAQSSKQSLEEAMSSVDLMMNFIRLHYDGVDEVKVVSDKCSNFNSFEQVTTAFSFCFLRTFLQNHTPVRSSPCLHPC
jgi:hypothetical protein